MQEFKLPDPGEGLLEADIVSWKVAIGDQVQVNDILLEIETAKSLVELPSPFAGVVMEILAAEGETVAVGSPIIRILGADEPTRATTPAPAAEPDPVGEAPASSAVLVGYGVKADSLSRRRRRADVPPVPTSDPGPVSATPAAPAKANPVTTTTPNAVPARVTTPTPARTTTAAGAMTPGGLPRAKPPVRRVARDLGIDLASVTPSGPGGTITTEDVLAAAGNSGERRIPVRGVQREMFRTMTASLSVPQATAFVEVDVTATLELIATLKRRRDFTGLRVSPLVVFAKAACLAIEKIPQINSAYDAETDEIVLRDDVNLGIAAATPRGLLVPNIKSANRLNLLELTQAMNDLVPLAKAGKVPPESMMNGTFSITNVGVFGVDGGTPIMNYGEAAIMCLGTILRKPWVVGQGENERIEPRSVCTVSLTFDHRLVDGEMGSRFLGDVSTILSDPALALLF